MTYANARDLAARIRAGEPADVFCSASERDPRALHAEGLLGPPLAFATNRLVVAVPAASDAADASVLGAPGTRVVIEVEGVPLGDYTRQVLAGTSYGPRALANVVAQETIVDAVAGRIVRGDADAGVLYATDVAARATALRALELPSLPVVYFAGAVRGAAPAAAAWVEALLAPSAQAVLRSAGFGAYAVPK